LRELFFPTDCTGKKKMSEIKTLITILYYCINWVSRITLYEKQTLSELLPFGVFDLFAGVSSAIACRYGV